MKVFDINWNLRRSFLRPTCLLLFLWLGSACSQWSHLLPVELSQRNTFLNTHQYQPRHGPLTEHEMAMAKVAWKYFENNYQSSTGLVNAVNNYPSTTLWDTASYLGGMVSAREFGIISKDMFDLRLIKLLKTMNTIELFRGEIPNKVYHTEQATKVDYGNQPGEIGFSALDLGRYLIWMYIIKQRYPEHANAIDTSILRWNFCNVVDENGTMFGAIVGPNDETQYLQEGRLGYEEYAARGFELWGFDTTRASMAAPYATINIYGIDVPYDTRDPRTLKAHSYVVTESYALDGIEFGWDAIGDRTSKPLHYTHDWMSEFAHRIYEVQLRRYQKTGIITARTEHQLDGPPYFVYDTIYSDGFAWNTIAETGDFHPNFAAVAIKGAMGLWALYDTEYTDLLFDHVSNIYNKEKGFYEGIYENGQGLINTYTANNNGILLESLLFKVQGPLLKYRDDFTVSRWEKAANDPFSHIGQCLPPSKPH